MSEHDEDGSAVTPLLLFPPPPPQPAARSASAAVTPTSVASQNLLLTLPPWSPIPPMPRPQRPLTRRGGQVSGQRGRDFNPEPPLQCLFKPKWRNWQTRRTQNPVGESPCGFESHLRHRAVGSRGEGRSRDGRRGLPRSECRDSGRRAPRDGSR